VLGDSVAPGRYHLAAFVRLNRDSVLVDAGVVDLRHTNRPQKSAVPPSLAGRWEAWFRLDTASRLPSETSAREVTGVVHFSPALAAPSPQSSPADRVVHAGTSAIDFRPFGFVLGSAEVLGWYENPDTVRIILDPTVDHGHLELVGSAEPADVTGHWRLHGDPARAEGEFRLHRLPRE
jgi:hypothetical protein